MLALAPAFRSIVCIAGLNLNYRKCWWVQYGNEEHDSLRTWISENCEEFREMQIVRHAKFVGTMIDPNGPSSLDGQEKFIHRVVKINASTKSLVERLCDLRDFRAEFHWLRLRSRQSHPQSREPCPPVYHSRTIQRNSLFSLLQVGSICGLGPDVVGIHSISLAAGYRVAACSSTLRRGLEKVNAARGHNCTPLFALSPA